MNPLDLKKVLIIGAGTMGHSIAQVYAQAGIEVNLLDKNEEILTKAKNQISSNLNVLTDFNLVKREEIQEIVDRVHPFKEIELATDNAELVLEAVSEIPELKKDIFFQLAELCPNDIIFASNTSSLDIFKVLKSIKNPSRLITHHWYAPPHIIPLVEIGATKKTSKEVIEFSVDLMKRLGKTPIVLERFTPGYIVNKIQNAISSVMYELLIRKIATPEQIDLAVKSSLGIRLPIVGIVQSQDFTGLDLVNDIIKNAGVSVPPIAERVDRGYLGAKTGIGFYNYEGKSEEEILRKRDEIYLKQLQFLKSTTDFEPI